MERAHICQMWLAMLRDSTTANAAVVFSMITNPVSRSKAQALATSLAPIASGMDDQCFS
jgi:hypothetical protein